MIPVLTYHSINITGHGYAENDHVALARDLEVVHRAGYRVIALDTLVDWIHGRVGDGDVANAVVLTFDDGSCLDWQDVEHPSFGPQRGFAGILRDFSGAHGVSLSATSFLIASPQARAELDRTCLAGLGWWGHEWWAEALDEGLIDLGSHSWDHLHPTLDTVAHSRGARGDFTAVDTRADADAQVARASAEIQRLAGRAPRVFAYPWGQASAYLSGQYLPRNGPGLGLEAAVTTEPRLVQPSDNPWTLPRLTCGDDWKSPEQLLERIGGS